MHACKLVQFSNIHASTEGKYPSKSYEYLTSEKYPSMYTFPTLTRIFKTTKKN